VSLEAATAAVAVTLPTPVLATVAERSNLGSNSTNLVTE